MLISTTAYAGGTVTTSSHRDCNDRNGCLDTYRWDYTSVTNEASDTTKTFTIYGKLVGAKFIEVAAGVTTETTVKVLDEEGRDVLQGLFTDTEASATATADSHFRVPVDDTSGGYIYVYDTVYATFTSTGDAETGALELYVIPFTPLLGN
jgi:hypothetical protein